MAVILRAAAPAARYPVRCLGTQCGELLGHAGPSGLEGRRGRQVWHIEPGWLFVGKPFGAERAGILERLDHEFRSERRLLYEVLGRERPIQGVAQGREAELPIHIRCPKCHCVQLVVARQIARRETPGGR